MDNPGSVVGRHAVKIVTVIALVAIYGFARLPTVPEAAKAELAAGFSFARYELPLPAVERERVTVRPVHPGLAHISGWISAVGAAVALADLDGDGLENDVCYVDTGSSSVVVTPAPTTGERYRTFTLEVAPALPYEAASSAPMGCLPGDFNEDGRQDALVYYWGRSAVAFLRRADAGDLSAAAFRPVEVSAKGERWYTNALSQADVDGDGRVDLIVGNYFPEHSEVINANATNPAEMQRSMSRATNGGHNHILLGQGGTAGAEPTASFVEAAGVLPGRADTGWTLALGAADLDGDLLPEIYFANDFGPDILLHNRSRPGRVELVPVEGKKRFAVPTSKRLGHDSFKGMGVDFADWNGDGRLDIYVSNIAAEWSLQESHFVWTAYDDPGAFARGIAPFRDQSAPLGLAQSGWGWDCRFADFDNDGVLEAVQATGFLRGDVNRWPELHEIAMGNDNMLHRPWAWPQLVPGDDLSGRQVNPFFVRAANGRYYDLAARVGLGEPVVTRAVSVADIDGDLDLDLAFGNQWDRSTVFRNDAKASGRSLLLDLRVPAASEPGRSRPAIGAFAKVRLADGRQLVGQVDGGSGHSGKRAPTLHFGLGASDEPVAVDVAWRDATGRVVERTMDLKPGRHTVVLTADGSAGEEG
jgi:enediyne biosynthesis protein E4